MGKYQFEQPLGTRNFFKELRKKAGSCAECGKGYSDDDRLTVHHIDHDRLNNNVENLTVLCNDCHTALHANDAQHYTSAELKRIVERYQILKKAQLQEDTEWMEKGFKILYCQQER